MLALALTCLFALTGLFVLGVLAVSYARAFAAFCELRRALAKCEETVMVSVRTVDHGGVRLKVVSSNRFRPLPQPELLAAA